MTKVQLSRLMAERVRRLGKARHYATISAFYRDLMGEPLVRPDDAERRMTLPERDARESRARRLSLIRKAVEARKDA